jgi:hypothetical protein
MAREIAAIGAVFAGGGAAPTPPPPEALPPVVAAKAPSDSGSGASQQPPRDQVVLTAPKAGPAPQPVAGQKHEPKLQLPPEELRARVSK